MSTATARTYRHGFSGWIAPVGSRKSPEIKSFHGYRGTVAGKAHCIKDSVLLDPLAARRAFWFPQRSI